MLAAGVPCVPGWHPSTSTNNNNQSLPFLLAEADKIGYPVLIKAVNGGGGKGMKIVENREEFEGQLGGAKREAMKGFGDDTVSFFFISLFLPSSSSSGQSAYTLVQHC